jgi:alkanesulfonate monooxygenase SsuD/methylene tetrahydromethanopterin reductase-like flavin-dependent oxidoreductase (luciferase family)
MRVGIVLPTRGIFLNDGPPDVALLTKQALRAEALGIDGVWVGDSLTAKPRLEPLTVLSAVGAVTSRVGLGTSVLLAPLRNPVQLAQQSATLQLLSGGRLTLAMGVGGTFNQAQQDEWRAAGVDPAGRGGRTTEMMHLLTRLWTGEDVAFHGRHFDYDHVSVGYPAGERVPRLLLACHSGEKHEAQYNRAARFGDGMMSITDSPEEFRQVRLDVQERVARLGRDADAFTSTFYMTVNLNTDEAAAQNEADRWVRGYYGVNFWGERWGPFGSPERVLERAQAYRDAGADEIVFRFASYDQAKQLEVFSETLLPALRA